MNKLLWVILFGLLILAVILLTMNIHKYTYKSLINPQKGIIVIRHGQDVDDKDIINGNFIAPIPCINPTMNILYQQKRLNSQGISSAKAFSSILNQVVTNLQIAHITDIYVKNPDQTGGPTTSNPFMTVYPYICDNNISPKGIHISQTFPAQADIQTMLNNSTGSIVICWDAESLWSDNSGENNCGRTNLPISGSIIKQLDKFYQIPEDQISKKVPKKGSTIYTYISHGKINIFNMTLGANGGILKNGYGTPC